MPRKKRQPPEFKPKKWPRQGRSKATFEAIVEACTRLLAAGDYAAVSTNAIAEYAGVGIGTLYEFFPNRESIVAVVAERVMERHRRDIFAGFEVAMGLSEWEGTRYWVHRLVEVVAADHEILRVLFRQVPFVPDLPAVRDSMSLGFEFARGVGRRARVNVPDLEMGVWLISRMVHFALLEIVFLDEPAADRQRRTDALARLVFRMLQGRDPDAGG